jgi:integrase
MTNLTDISLIEYLLSNPQPGGERIPVHIRTKEKCPICKKNFKQFQRIGYICPSHKTQPNRYFIDVYYQKQLKIYSHKSGRVLDSYQLAIETLDMIKNEIRNKTFDPSKWVAGDQKKFYFDSMIKKWLENKKEKIATAHKYEQFNRDYFTPFFKTTDIRDIKTSNIHELYDSLPKHLNPKTKKNIMTGLHSFFNWVLYLEYIEKMPMFPKIETSDPDWQWLDVDEQEKLLMAIPETDRHLFLFLALHGCRPSEARSLKVKDIDFTRLAITIRRTFSGKSGNILVEHTKTRKNRIIPINLDFLHALKQICNNRFGEDFVFLNPRTQKPYSKTTYGELWDKARKETKINITSYEALRHSFASQRVTRNIDLYSISKVLGHTDIKTTQRYSHVNLDSLKKIMSLPAPTPLSQTQNQK